MIEPAKIYEATRTISECKDRLVKMRKVHEGIDLSKPGKSALVVIADEFRIEVTESRYGDYHVVRGYEMLALGMKKLLAEEIARLERKMIAAAKLIAEAASQ